MSFFLRYFGHRFTLAKGLHATLYRLDHRRLKEVATACVEIAPSDREKHFAVVIALDGKEIAIVPHFQCDDDALIDEVKSALLCWALPPDIALLQDPLLDCEILGGQYELVYDGTAYSPSSSIGQELKKAVLHKLRPTICTLLHGTEQAALVDLKGTSV